MGDLFVDSGRSEEEGSDEERGLDERECGVHGALSDDSSAYMALVARACKAMPVRCISVNGPDDAPLSPLGNVYANAWWLPFYRALDESEYNQPISVSPSTAGLAVLKEYAKARSSCEAVNTAAKAECLQQINGAFQNREPITMEDVDPVLLNLIGTDENMDLPFQLLLAPENHTKITTALGEKVLHITVVPESETTSFQIDADSVTLTVEFVRKLTAADLMLSGCAEVTMELGMMSNAIQGIAIGQMMVGFDSYGRPSEYTNLKKVSKTVFVPASCFRNNLSDFDFFGLGTFKERPYPLTIEHQQDVFPDASIAAIPKPSRSPFRGSPNFSRIYTQSTATISNKPRIQNYFSKSPRERTRGGAGESLGNSPEPVAAEPADEPDIDYDAFVESSGDETDEKETSPFARVGGASAVADESKFGKSSGKTDDDEIDYGAYVE